MSIDRVQALKIYGERNSGTNYLERLIELNIDVAVVKGNDPLANRKLYKAIKAILPYSTGEHIVERIRDRRTNARFAVQMGWKHAAIPCFPKGTTTYPAGTGFISLTKNPYAWLLSLYRRPYQNMQVKRDYLSFEDFLQRPWPTVGREGGTHTRYETPVDLWNQKTASYDLLKQYGTHIRLRYEDVLADFTGTLDHLVDTFNLVPLRTQFSQIARSTKPGHQSNSDYGAYYLEERWRSELSPNVIALINEHLDTDVVALAGYSRIETP